MQKIYEEVKVKIILFVAVDVVALSENAKDDVVDDIFAPNK